MNRIRIGRHPDLLPGFVEESERYGHMAIFGKTGTGKSSFILNMWNQDSYAPTAKILIDPSGILAKEAYDISGGLFCSIDNPIGINPLSCNYHPMDIADMTIEAINQTVRASTENMPLTVKMRRVLTDAVCWCISKGRISLEAVVDRMTIAKGAPAETVQGIVDRLNLLIQDERMKAIVCEAPPVDWGELIAKNRTLILDCSGLSEEKMTFLGALVSQSVKGYLRFNRGIKRNPVAFYIDEFQNFVNENFYTILKEGRKYKIGAVMATQDFSMIPDKLRDIILSNVRTMIVFSVGWKEASRISNEIPEMSLNDIMGVEKHHFIMKKGNEVAILEAYRPPITFPRAIGREILEKRSLNMKWFDIDESCQR